MMDYLYPQNEEHTHWSMNRGSCSCCAGQYQTDPEAISEFVRPIIQMELDTWEEWLHEQLAYVYQCRQTRVTSPMLKPYHPTMEEAWDVAVIQARILGEMWRGKELPDHAVGNEMQASLARILDEYKDHTGLAGLFEDHEEQQDALSTIFFTEYVKMECKTCGRTGDPTIFHDVDYCSQWCAENPPEED